MGLKVLKYEGVEYLYRIMATKDYMFTDDGETLLNIVLKTDFLTVGNYNLVNNKITCVFYWPNIKFPNTWINENDLTTSDFTINITKLENGYADGTFSGNLNKKPSYKITEGEFKNVKVLQ
jgi:hypothetical protein